MSSHTGKMLAAGDGTAAAAMLRLIGADNVLGTQTGYKPFSAEAAAALRPDVIVTTTLSVNASGGLDAFLAQAGLNVTPAARDRARRGDGRSAAARLRPAPARGAAPAFGRPCRSGSVGALSRRLPRVPQRFHPRGPHLSSVRSLMFRLHGWRRPAPGRVFVALCVLLAVKPRLVPQRAAPCPFRARSSCTYCCRPTPKARPQSGATC
ncbi:ABC transporter substrate-binding protein [Cupriavidus basilensis]